MQVDLNESWRIGAVEIPSRLVLAPMAGVSVQAFRRQGRRFGAGLVCSEMVSCAGLSHKNERTLGYLRKFYPWYGETMGLTKAENHELCTAPTTAHARSALDRLNVGLAA